MLLYFGYCLVVVFVSMRIRAECGLPWAYFMPGFEMVLVLAGGLALFGSGGTMFGVLSIYLFIAGLFYLIPGAQLELLELGRRWRVRPRHLALTCLLAKGHLLIEDIPGIGKTTLAKVLSKCLGLNFRRIQCTSDMLPGDILGVSIQPGGP